MRVITKRILECVVPVRVPMPHGIGASANILFGWHKTAENVIDTRADAIGIVCKYASGAAHRVLRWRASPV